MNHFTRVLILETSGKIGHVAVANEGRMTAARQLPETRRHARDLAVRSAELFALTQWKAKDLTAIVVSTGPGSYTGLRVGVASAKALAFATGAKLFGIPTFEAIAFGISVDVPSLEIIADAQQGQVYHQQFKRDTFGNWKPTGTVGIQQYEEWSNNLLPGCVIAGPAASTYSSRLPMGVLLACDAEREIRPESLLCAAIAGGDGYLSNPWEVEPIYLRGSSAEEKRKRSSASPNA